MLIAPATASAWFLAFVGPICFYVAFSDMARMKIPNLAVMAMVVVFAVVGIFVLPFEDYAWRWLHLIVVLVVGFFMNMVGLVGAGDAKFAAAMAPFIVVGDLFSVLLLFAAVMLAAFITHRTARAIPAVRRLAPHWESWTRKDFPMGLALGASMAAYLALAAKFGTA
ncbi:prepilin peptidase [Vannielia sp.]|uniref:prepilin peptidase n=1 Tax=Vannielia sp. TaxID=2813045 RepID=UPI0026225333|nr:prepilin peptidase [Vannielia sp.]MDF1872251.1 prepilin peptidase [Vannielia sp.]